MITAEEFVQKFGKEKQRDSVIYGTVSEVGEDGKPRIIIDGETTASVKRYPYLSSYKPVVDDRVMIRDGVVMGGIGGHTEDTTQPIYGVKIDNNNSNPATAVTHIDKAISVTNWDDVFPFNAIRPVLFKNGVVVGELQKNDFSKFLNGTSADITSGNSGDVMIEFPKVYWKIETVGMETFVWYSPERIDSTWVCLAHTNGVVEKTHVYIGAYLSRHTPAEGLLKSISGTNPLGQQTIETFTSYAQNKGAGYDLTGYYQILMLQVLYLVRYKNLDAQKAVGRGYVNTGLSVAQTGGTNQKGMIFGSELGNLQIKLFGLEDLWGNRFWFVGGLQIDSNRNLLLRTFRTDSYQSVGSLSDVNVSGYISSVQGDTIKGFIVKTPNGSATTFYPDNGAISANSSAQFGGSAGFMDAAGIFNMNLNLEINYLNQVCVARLMYL